MSIKFTTMKEGVNEMDLTMQIFILAGALLFFGMWWYLVNKAERDADEQDED